MRISTFFSFVLSSRAAISVTATTGKLIVMEMSSSEVGWAIITGIGPISSSIPQQKDLVSWVPNALEDHAKVSSSQVLNDQNFQIKVHILSLFCSVHLGNSNFNFDLL